MTLDRRLTEYEWAFIEAREAQGARRRPYETAVTYLCRLMAEHQRQENKLAVDPQRTEEPRESLPQAARSLVDAWQAVAQTAAHLAHARRTVFLAYVAEGFTEAQALELVKSI